MSMGEAGGRMNGEVRERREPFVPLSFQLESNGAYDRLIVFSSVCLIV